MHSIFKSTKKEGLKLYQHGHEVSFKYDSSDDKKTFDWEYYGRKLRIYEIFYVKQFAIMS